MQKINKCLKFFYNINKLNQIKNIITTKVTLLFRKKMLLNNINKYLIHHYVIFL
jgi:hypothetical protein